jgi:hypothetical protein
MAIKLAQEVKAATDTIFESKFQRSFETLTHIVSEAIEAAQESGAYHATILLHETKNVDRARYTSTKYFLESNMTMVSDIPIQMQVKLSSQMRNLLESLGYKTHCSKPYFESEHTPHWHMIQIHWYNVNK